MLSWLSSKAYPPLFMLPIIQTIAIIRQAVQMYLSENSTCKTWRKSFLGSGRLFMFSLVIGSAGFEEYLTSSVPHTCHGIWVLLKMTLNSMTATSLTPFFSSSKATFCWRRHWTVSNKDAIFCVSSCWSLCYIQTALPFINLKIYDDHENFSNIVQRYLWMGIYLIALCTRCDCFHFQWVWDNFYKAWKRKNSGHFGDEGSLLKKRVYLVFLHLLD